MQFDIITIFPNIFDSYFSESILGRAQKNKLINIAVHNLRDYTTDRHHTVDDKPYGGGAGMVLKIEPIYKAVLALIPNVISQKSKTQTKNRKTRIILFSAKGKRYTQNDARRLAKYDRLIMICGRYEGVDERVARYVSDEEMSIGDFVLTGGELPAMIVVDSVSRLISGVVGKNESIEDESFKKIKADRKKYKNIETAANDYLEYPHYTRPEIFSPCGKKKWRVPKVLLSGDHGMIKKWREENAELVRE